MFLRQGSFRGIGTRSLLVTRLGKSCAGTERVSDDLRDGPEAGRQHRFRQEGGLAILHQTHVLHALHPGERDLLHQHFRRHRDPADLRRRDIRETQGTDRQLHGDGVSGRRSIDRHNNLRAGDPFLGKTQAVLHIDQRHRSVLPRYRRLRLSERRRLSGRSQIHLVADYPHDWRRFRVELRNQIAALGSDRRSVPGRGACVLRCLFFSEAFILILINLIYKSLFKSIFN